MSNKIINIILVGVIILTINSFGYCQIQQEKKTTYIYFQGWICESTVKNLISIVQKKLEEGIPRFVILISSLGGEVSYGTLAYNYLKGIPAEVVTHNINEVSSTAVILYCAGSRRLSVPNSRFVLHSISRTFAPPNNALDIKALQMNLVDLRTITKNMAQIIANSTGKKVEDVENDFIEKKILNSNEAKEYGLVTEIIPQIFEQNSDVVFIQ